MKNDVFETYSVPKAAMTLALPTVLSMLVTIFYNMADTFFVGQTGDANQVAAVSLATPVFLLLMAVGNMFGIGGSSMISRLLGEQNGNKVKHVSSFCFYGGILAGIFMMILFLAGMPVVLNIMGTSANTRGYAEEYMRYIAFGAVFVVLANAFNNVVRGEGAAKTSMIGMMVGTIVNIVLDPVMILWMDMGVAGAAIATVIGNICTVLYYLYYFARKKTSLSISPKHFMVKDHIMSGVLMIGIPASVNNILMSTANIILNNFLAKYGDNQVAAMGVATKVNMLVILVQIGVASGVMPLIGYCYGAGKATRLKKAMQFAAVCNVVMGTVITIVYFLFTEPIIEAFINNQEVVSYGIVMLRALMISGPVIGIMFVISFSIQAMGKALQSLVLALSRQGLVFLPVLLIADKLIGLDGIIFAQPIADIMSLLIALLLFRSIAKSLKEEEKKEHEHDAVMNQEECLAEVK